MATSSTGTISAAGIGSNIDVNALVTQLMASERRPLTRLQGKISELSGNLSEYGRVQSEVSALQSAARAIGTATALDVFRATLSDATAGTVTTGTAAAAGEYSVRVTALASAQTLVSPNSLDGVTRISDAGAVISGSADIAFAKVGGGSFSISVDGLSLNGIRDAINNASDNVGVLASVINDGSGFRLVVRTRDTGAANGLSGITVNESTPGAGVGDLGFLRFASGTPFTDSAMTMGESVAASDASAVIDGVTVTSSSNVFASAIEGVTFAAAAVTASPVKLSVKRDDDSLVAKVQAFVDAYNTFAANNATRYGKGGSLEAQGTLLTMMTGFSGLITQQGGPSGNAFGYLFQLGVSVDKFGKLSLDSSKLRSALSDDSVAVGKLLGDGTTGILARFNTLATAYLATDGVLSARQSGIRSSTDSLNDQIDTLSVRLATIEGQYRIQFSKLDSLLGSLRQTSVALTRTLG